MRVKKSPLVSESSIRNSKISPRSPDFAIFFLTFGNVCFLQVEFELYLFSNCVDLSCFCTVESIRNQRRSARSGNLQLFGTFLTDNQVLIWKFNRLDRNRDKLLVSSEFLTSTMKKILGNVKRGRKCGKKLLVDCDLDKDRGLSMMEWTLCLRIHDRRMPLQ